MNESDARGEDDLGRREAEIKQYLSRKGIDNRQSATRP